MELAQVLLKKIRCWYEMSMLVLQQISLSELRVNVIGLGLCQYDSEFEESGWCTLDLVELSWKGYVYFIQATLEMGSGLKYQEFLYCKSFDDNPEIEEEETGLR